MNFKIKRSAQAGFTLIELIVVIVILGILAATALPKFVNLGGDARFASLQAAKGSLTSVAAMTHGRFLANGTGTPLSTISAEGTTVNMNTTSGYPTADANMAAAAGITTNDYTILTSGTGSSTVPAVPTNSFVIVPNSVAGTAAALTCNLAYTTATAVNTQPTYTLTASASGC